LQFFIAALTTSRSEEVEAALADAKFVFPRACAHRVVLSNDRGLCNLRRWRCWKRASFSTQRSTPTPDLYVRDGTYATTNYGTWQQMQAKQGATDLQRQIFMKFDLTGVAGSVGSAKLKVWGRRSNTNDSAFAVAVKGVADTAWSESTTNCLPSAARWPRNR
jgi:hypothetical protein